MPETLAWTPSNATAVKVKPRKLKAQFGNGYTQDAADGINNVLRNWTTVWTNIPFANAGTYDNTKLSIRALNDFFMRQYGVVKFLWIQPPPVDVEGPKTFICEDWDWVYNGGLICGVRATLEQRPDLS